MEYQSTGRKLKYNHASQLPRYIIAFDCETLPKAIDDTHRKFSHRFRLATATMGRIVGTKVQGVNRCRFHDTDDLWTWIKSKTAANYTTWIVSHNALFDLIVGGFMERFDCNDLVPEWPRTTRKGKNGKPKSGESSGSVVIESPPTIIAARITDTNARVVFLDSLNWFKCPLAELGERLGMPKLPMPEFTAPDDEWFTYCQRDSDILFQTFTELIHWVRSNNFGMFRYTAPGQAMNAYRHRFMETPIFIHDNMKVKRVERLSYFGGRTEVFRKGLIREKVYQLDVNSLFPFVMSKYEFPYMLERYDLMPGFMSIPPNVQWAQAVASVILVTDEPIYPVRTDECVIYPVGSFVTTLCGLELADAFSKGHVRWVGSWAEYKVAPLFRKWVAELYDMRQGYKRNGDELYSTFVKLMMNSLYGKWGEKAPKWVNDNHHKGGLPWSTWTERSWPSQDSISYRMFGMQCQRKGPTSETDKSFVAISAFVTSAARMEMNRLRKIAYPCNCYYQGVDGLIVNQAGLDNLENANEIHNDELGKLRLLRSANECEVFGCADYRIGDKVIISGRSRQLDHNEQGETMQRKFYAANRLFLGVATTDIVETVEPWVRSAVVRKGIETADGWIHPHVLSHSNSDMVT